MSVIPKCLGRTNWMAAGGRGEKTLACADTHGWVPVVKGHPDRKPRALPVPLRRSQRGSQQGPVLATLLVFLHRQFSQAAALKVKSLRQSTAGIFVLEAYIPGALPRRSNCNASLRTHISVSRPFWGKKDSQHFLLTFSRVQSVPRESQGPNISSSLATRMGTTTGWH